MEDKTYSRLIDSVKAFARDGAVKYRVSLPNKHFDPSSYPYLEVKDFRLDPRTNGTEDSRHIKGLLQITVVDEKNVGIDRANELAEEVISAYPVGLNLFNDPICVTVPDQASKRPYLGGDKDIKIPVIIPYQSFISTDV